MKYKWKVKTFTNYLECHENIFQKVWWIKYFDCTLLTVAAGPESLSAATHGHSPGPIALAATQSGDMPHADGWWPHLPGGHTHARVPGVCGARVIREVDDAEQGVWVDMKQ